MAKNLRRPQWGLFQILAEREGLLAALDYLSNVRNVIRHPRTVDQSDFDHVIDAVSTDELTGLYNRRHMKSAYRREIRRARRYGGTLTILLIDVGIRRENRFLVPTFVDAEWGAGANALSFARDKTDRERFLFLPDDMVHATRLDNVGSKYQIDSVSAYLGMTLAAWRDYLRVTLGEQTFDAAIANTVLQRFYGNFSPALAGNLAFHAGLMGLLEDGIRIGLYSGVYIIVALILVMARRVYPFFIERGVGYHVELRNRTWLDIASLLLFLVFWIFEIVDPDSLPVALLCITLAILHTIRLNGWHTTGIWRRPLLWVLFIGYGWLIAAFALKAAAVLFGVAPVLALHAFAFGGIGMITLGMMSRVTLGHTGRSIAEPPAVLAPAFLLLLAGAVIRVLLPLLVPAHYAIWVSLSQVLWVMAFASFTYVFLPMLWQTRVDGRPG